MDKEIHFRGLLIRLQHSLSDKDRRSLRFLFGHILPGRLSDDPAINDTLLLLESLIHQGKINAEDFNCLIQAFQEIGRQDIAKRLQAHSQEIGRNVKPEQCRLLQQIIDDAQEDKRPSIERQENGFQREPDKNIITFPPLLPLSKISGSARQASSINDRSWKLNAQHSLTIWAHWRKILFGLIIIGLLITVILVIVIRSRRQPESPENLVNNATEQIPNHGPPRKTAPVILGYFISWSVYARNYFVYNITADKMTHISYAFAKIDSNGRIEIGDRHADIGKEMLEDNPEQPLRGNFNQLKKLKKKYPHLRTLIMVGSYEYSDKFSDVAMNAANRSRFAASCVQFVQEYDFDGIDISWQYPVSGGSSKNVYRREDKENYVLLLKELRQQLNTVVNKTYLLTVQVGVGAHIDNLDLPGMITYLDWINVQTYNFHGNWDAETNHHAALYQNPMDIKSDFNSKLNCDAAVQAYMDSGVPSKKIVMGIPLYGRGWQGVKTFALNGYLQSTSSVIPNGTWEKGVFDYDHLKKEFIPKYQRYFDNHSKVPFLFNPSTGIWISYEDSKSISWKTDYINQRRLGGAFFWDLSCDHQAELIHAIFMGLTNGRNSSSMNHRSTRSLLTSPLTNNIHSWKLEVQYEVGDQVTYKDKVYHCIQAHQSVPNKIPDSEDLFWQMETALISTENNNDNKTRQSTRSNNYSN